jgi:hypothetical protein
MMKGADAWSFSSSFKYAVKKATGSISLGCSIPPHICPEENSVVEVPLQVDGIAWHGSTVGPDQWHATPPS